MIDRNDWCSPSNPKLGCRPESYQGQEVCKPMTHKALAAFKKLQTAVVLLLARDQELPVQVDGRLGSETLSAVNLYISPGFKNCNDLAGRADEIAARLQAMLAKPASPTRPIAKPKKAGFPLWLAVVGLAVAVIVFTPTRAKSKR